ncbi:MAG: M28 family peptidase [Sphingobacteriales bacterium]|nr:MAG: M28 family peptidase [Sphingobacteriales bacterium]
MMKKLSILPLLFLGVSAFAQVDDAAKYAGIIRTSELQKHLTIIAHDDMEGRETGTRGQRKAAEYIENFFKTIGLKAPAPLKGKYQQLYPLYQDSMVSGSLKVGGKEAVYGTDYLSPVNNNETIKAKGKSLVFVGYGIDDAGYNDYEGLDVKGKVVVFFLGEPKKDGKYFIDTKSSRGSAWTFPGLSKKLELAAQKGAVGAMVINANSETFSSRAADASKKTNVYYPRANSGAKKINYVQLSHAYAKTILGEQIGAAITKAKSNSIFEAKDKFEQKTKTNIAYKKHRSTIDASNVLGVIEGTDKKDEFVFITAHYDHVGIINGQIHNGADDDGSGTVAIMQIGEAFVKAKAEGKGPRRTVVIMAVSGEEKGLWGSEYYSDNPLYSLDKTTVDLNIDMIGRVDTERMKDDTLNYVYVVGHNKLSSDLPIINEGMNNKYTQLVLDYKFDDPKDPNRIYFRSDHYNFARKGVPVLFFYDGMLKSDYHKPGDDVEKIYWPLLEKRARMVFHTAWEMANRDEMLKRDIPLDNQTR